MAGKLRLCFADTETSGLAESVEDAIANDRQVIEYCFKVWEEGSIKRSIVRRVMPTGDALHDAVDCAKAGYNRFNPDEWWTRVGFTEHGRAKPWCKEDRENVSEFLQGETLAGSNPRFDLIMLKAEFARDRRLEDFPKLATHRMMNTGDLAWLLWSVRLVDKTGLETLTKLLGIEHKAHTAEGDVDACIKVFETMCDTLVGGPRKLKRLCEAIIDTLDDEADRTFARDALGKVRVL